MSVHDERLGESLLGSSPNGDGYHDAANKRRQVYSPPNRLAAGFSRHDDFPKLSGGDPSVEAGTGVADAVCAVVRRAGAGRIVADGRSGGAERDGAFCSVAAERRPGTKFSYGAGCGADGDEGGL